MLSLREFIPKLFICLKKGYSLSTFKKDLMAGVTIGIIALPLAMAFGIASGVSPEKGLITAIVAGFLISALGGSRVQIGGPTGAFVILVYTIVQRSGYEGLALSTLIAALFLILLALFRLGSWIKYIPHPLIVGFTSGLALCIFSTQIKDFFGFKIAALPVEFIDKWETYFHSFHTLHLPTFLLGIGTLALILAIRRWAPKVPWGIAAIAISTLVAFIFDLPVETIQSKFGQIPNKIPLPAFPNLSIPIEQLGQTLMDAIAIAFLGGIESLLSCVIADGMTGSKHRSNVELLGQGIANIGSVLFGGIPATGAIARTAANVKSGAQTPVAGIIHAITLLGIVLFLSPIVSQIPLASLSAVLMMVAWNMSEMNHFLRLCRAPAADVVILVASFFLTVLVDITAAISVGMILASFLFMKKMSDHFKALPFKALYTEDQFSEALDWQPFNQLSLPENVEAFEIQGPFFFGTADTLKDFLELKPKVFILRMKHVPMIDASGMHALKEFYSRCKSQKIELYLSGIQKHLISDVKKYAHVEEKHIFPSFQAALEQAKISS